MADVVDRFDEPVSSTGQTIVDRFDAAPVDYSKLGEFDAKKATEGQKWRLAFGYLTTPNIEARADIIRNVLPGARIERDPNNGRPIVHYKGESGYIDAPGVTLGGVLDGIAQIGKYIPAGRFAAGGATLVGQGLRAGGAAALTSVAEDVAAIPQGSEQGVSPSRAAIAGAGGFIGQLLSPVVGRGVNWLSDRGAAVWRALRGTPGATTAQGTLTDVGRRMAQQAGLDPDAITPQLARELEAAARQATAAAVPEEQIPLAIRRQALSQRFRVPLTRGEITDDYAQQSIEENLRRMDVTTRAGQIMRQAGQESTERLRGDTGESGFGLLRREIGGEVVPDVSDAGQQVIASTQARAAAAQGAYRQAYRTAREYGAALDARNFKQFLAGTESALKDSIDYDASLFPRTARILERLRGMDAFMQESGRSAPRKIPLARLENTRKLINAEWKSADATDRMGLDVLRAQFDEMVNGAIDEGRIVGDAKAVEAWKQGRALYQRFQELYRPSREAGQAEQQAGRIVQNWLRSDAVTGEEVIRQAVQNRALTSRILEINGRDSPAHVALKQGALEYVFRPALRNDTISPRLLVSQYDRFFKGATKEQLQAIYSPRELQAIREFVELARAKIPQEGVVNFSNTGNVLVKAAQQLGQKLGIIGAASGNLETAAALGAVNTLSGARATAQARSAVQGLVPRPRAPEVVTGTAAGTGSAVGARYEQ